MFSCLFTNGESMGKDAPVCDANRVFPLILPSWESRYFNLSYAGFLEFVRTSVRTFFSLVYLSTIYRFCGKGGLSVPPSVRSSEVHTRLYSVSSSDWWLCTMSKVTLQSLRARSLRLPNNRFHFYIIDVIAFNFKDNVMTVPCACLRSTSTQKNICLTRHVLCFFYFYISVPFKIDVFYSLFILSSFSFGGKFFFGCKYGR